MLADGRIGQRLRSVHSGREGVDEGQLLHIAGVACVAQLHRAGVPPFADGDGVFSRELRSQRGQIGLGCCQGLGEESVLDLVDRHRLTDVTAVGPQRSGLGRSPRLGDQIRCVARMVGQKISQIGLVLQERRLEVVECKRALERVDVGLEPASVLLSDDHALDRHVEVDRLLDRAGTTGA